MRLFAPERIASMMDKLGAQEGEVITHRFLTRAIEQAQKRVEGHHFAIRKHLLEYDDVMNQQREVIYTLRNAALEKADLRDRVAEMMTEQVQALIDKHVSPSAHPDQWDLTGLGDDMQMLLLAPVDLSGERLSYQELQERCQTAARNAYADREALFGPDQMREIERWILLRVIDEKWRDHLYEIDQLRAGIGLRAYGQKDPLLEYKREAFDMFEELMANIDADTVRYLFRVMPARPQQAPPPPPAPRQGEAAVPAAGNGSEGAGAPAPAPQPAPRRAPEPAETVVVGAGGLAARPMGAIRENKPAAGTVGGPRTAAPAAPEPPPQTFVRDQPKVGRNDPCPCGSGKKYKKCHGASA